MTQLSIVFERILDSIQKVFSNLFGWIIALFRELLNPILDAILVITVSSSLAYSSSY